MSACATFTIPETAAASLGGGIGEKAGAHTVRTTLLERVQRGELELPMLPEIVTEVMAAVSDESTSARRLAELVRRDPSLAGHVLRIANSALYRPTTPIISLQHAVSRLGMTTLRDILLIVGCETSSFHVRGRDREMREEFQAALASATFAQEIARAGRTNVENAFTAGLLHDVGRPVLVHAIMDIAQKTGATLDRASETALVDELHAKVGAELVLRWKLPMELADAIAHHHAPTPASGVSPMAALIAVADACSRFARGASDAPSEEGVTEHGLLPLLDLYPDDLKAILARGQDIVARARGAA